MEQKKRGALISSLSLQTAGQFPHLVKQNPMAPEQFLLVNTDFSLAIVALSDTGGLTEVRSFAPQHQDKIEDATFHSISDETGAIHQLILTVSADSTLRVWNVASGLCAHKFQSERPLFSVAARDSLALCGSYQKLFTWNLVKLKMGGNFKDHSDDITALQLAQNPQFLLSCSEDELICVRDLSQSRDEGLIAAIPTGCPLVECGFIEENKLHEEAGIVWALSTMNSLLIYDVENCDKIAEFAGLQLMAEGVILGGLQKLESSWAFIVGNADGKLQFYEVQKPWREAKLCGKVDSQQQARNARIIGERCLVTTESGKIQVYSIAPLEEQKQAPGAHNVNITYQASVSEDFLLIDDEAEAGPIRPLGRGGKAWRGGPK